MRSFCSDYVTRYASKDKMDDEEPDDDEEKMSSVGSYQSDKDDDAEPEPEDEMDDV